MRRGGGLEDWAAVRRRTILITFDALAWGAAIAVASLLRYADGIDSVPWARALTGIAIVIGLQWVMATVFWLYDGRFQIGSRAEAVALAKAFLATTLILELVSLLFRDGRLLPLSVPIGAGLGALALASAMRLVARSLRESTSRPEGAAPALVLGVGSAGTQLIYNMLRHPESPYIPVGLLDDDPRKRHRHIEGIPVLGNRTALKSAMEQTRAEVLIIAIPRRARSCSATSRSGGSARPEGQSPAEPEEDPDRAGRNPGPA